MDVDDEIMQIFYSPDFFHDTRCQWKRRGENIGLIYRRRKYTIITSQQAEMDTVIATAKAMCAAARTAPKAKGMDFVRTAILTGSDKDALADKMDRLADQLGMGFFHSDAGNVRNSMAIVVIGQENAVRGLNEGCRFCGFENCKACMEAGGSCAYTGVDLGIAVGSAVSIAAENRVDNRIMFSAGRAAMELNILGEEVTQAFGIPLNASGKSPYFDRK